MDFSLLHPTDQLVMIMDRIYNYGMTTTSGGNISIRDQNGDIWITPSGIDKGSLTRKDIVRIKYNGETDGIHKPSVEFPFHRMIYEKRPDVRAVIHAHSPALVSFSIVRKTPSTKLLPNAHLVCGNAGMSEYRVPGSKELGLAIAAQFEKGHNIVMLENHGVAAAADNLFKAFKIFETLDFCARMEIYSSNIGTPKILSDKHLEIQKQKQHIPMEEFRPAYHSSAEREARREMCSLIHRAYDQKLFTSTQGTFSQKLDDDLFIITPYDVDRKYLKEEDLVRIENGRREAGKIPSRSVMLHRSIYQKHPHIRSVIIAHPPCIMAFTVTDNTFDSKIIPESYIMLGEVQKLPFGSNFMQSHLVAEAFTKKNSIVIIENDCIITTGSSLLKAFDRLEVAEYSAMALISSARLGSVVKIDPQQIKEIEEAFCPT